MDAPQVGRGAAKSIEAIGQPRQVRFQPTDPFSPGIVATSVRAADQRHGKHLDSDPFRAGDSDYLGLLSLDRRSRHDRDADAFVADGRYVRATTFDGI